MIQVKEEPHDDDDEPIIIAVESAATPAEEIFTVERLLKKRHRKGTTEYYVKWKGYSSKHNSWEPRDNILSDRLIEIYEEEAARKQQVKNNKRGRHSLSSQLSTSPTSSMPSNMSLRKRRTSTATYQRAPRRRYDEDDDYTDDDDASDEFEIHGSREPKSPRVRTTPSYRSAQQSNNGLFDSADDHHSFQPLEPLLPAQRATIKITDVKLQSGTVTFIEAIDSDNSSGSPEE